MRSQMIFALIVAFATVGLCSCSSVGEDVDPNDRLSMFDDAHESWNGQFDQGLGWWDGAWWLISSNSGNQLQLVYAGAGRSRPWVIDTSVFLSSPASIKFEAPDTLLDDQEVHGDLLSSHHFPVTPGERLRLTGCFQGAAGVRFGIDFRMGFGDHQRLALAFTDWHRQASWTRVIMDQDNPGSQGPLAAAGAERLIVPPGTEYVVVWLQFRARRGETGWVDDIKLERIGR